MYNCLSFAIFKMDIYIHIYIEKIYLYEEFKKLIKVKLCVYVRVCVVCVCDDDDDLSLASLRETKMAFLEVI